MQRIRVHFAKTEAMRYTGHLDLQRAWERILRRAGLPAAYSQGYNPRPRLQLATALPLGFTSQAEIVDFWLDPPLEVLAVEKVLREALPPGIHIHAVEEVVGKAPALQSVMRSAEYLVTLLDFVPGLEGRVASLLAAAEIRRVRRGKPYDLRPLVFALEILPPEASGKQRLFMHLSARESATGRPDEVLSALGIPPHTARVHRTALHYADEAGPRGRN